MPHNLPKVTVSIVSFNSKKYLASCLSAVLEQSYSNLEIFFIDNASTDGSFTYLQKKFAARNINFIKNNQNLGYAGGHNLGIARSNSKYILCLNPDIILNKNYIQTAVTALEKNKPVGAVTGKILKYKLDNNQAVKTKIIDTLGLTILKSHRVVEKGANQEDRGQHHKTTKIFGVSGAAPVLRRQALESIQSGTGNNIQYFDQSFHSYKEDVDLSWRLQHAGWQCLLVPSALAWHDRWETGSNQTDRDQEVITKRKRKSARVNYYSYRNHWLVNLKNEFLVNWLICSPYIVWYELKKLVYLIIFERHTLKGLLDIIKSLPLTLKKRRDIFKKSKIKPSAIRRWF